MKRNIDLLREEQKENAKLREELEHQKTNVKVLVKECGRWQNTVARWKVRERDFDRRLTGLRQLSGDVNRTLYYLTVTYGKDGILRIPQTLPDGKVTAMRGKGCLTIHAAKEGSDEQ